MKRKILPVAVATIITGTAMSASAGTTLYGKVNATLQSIELENVGVEQDNWEVRSNSSRFGLKGSQDIDDGLTAIWQLELEYDNADGNVDGDELKQRDSYVGVKGDFGTVVVGRMDTPLKDAQGKLDLFSDLYAGDIKNVLLGEQRVSNAVAYTSNESDGFTVTVAAIPGEETGANAENDGIADHISAVVTYKAEDLLDMGLDGVVISAATDRDVAGADIIRLVIETKYEGVTLAALYQTAEESERDQGFTQGGLANATAVTGQIAAAEQDGFAVSASYPYDDKWTLKAQYAYSETEGRDLVAANGTTGTVDVEQMTFGADYKLGANTKAFGYYSMAEGEANLAGVKTLEQTTLAVGLQHKF